MASATGAAIGTLVSSPVLADGRLSSRHPGAILTPYSTILPSLPPLLRLSSHVRLPRGFKDGRKIAPIVVATATGETPAEVATELPEFVTTLKEAWDRLGDKYAVTSLAFASLIALYGSFGLINAIDRLPLVPGLFELIGIGYTGWFAYRNLVFKPDREALIAKVKDIYGDVLGSNSS